MLVPTHLHPLSPPGQTPEALHCPLRVVLHPPFSLPEIAAPPPARPDAMSPQDSALRVPRPQLPPLTSPLLSCRHSPLHSSAPTTHLSTRQHSPCLYHEQVGAGTTPILQSACLSAFRPHMNHTGQTKAQRPLAPSPEPRSLGAASAPSALSVPSSHTDPQPLNRITLTFFLVPLLWSVVQLCLLSGG